MADNTNQPQMAMSTDQLAALQNILQQIGPNAGLNNTYKGTSPEIASDWIAANPQSLGGQPKGNQGNFNGVNSGQSVSPSQQVLQDAAKKQLKNWAEAHAANTDPQTLSKFVDNSSGFNGFGGGQTGGYGVTGNNMPTSQNQQQPQEQTSPQQTLASIVPPQNNEPSLNMGGPSNPNDPLQQKAQQIALQQPGLLGSIFRGTFEAHKEEQLNNIKNAQEITQGGAPISPEKSQALDVDTYKAMTDNASTASTNAATKLSDYIKLYQEQRATRGQFQQAIGGPTSDMNETMKMIDSARKDLNQSTDQLKTLHDNPPRTIGKQTQQNVQRVTAGKNQSDKQAAAISGKLKSGIGFSVVNNKG